MTKTKWWLSRATCFISVFSGSAVCFSLFQALVAYQVGGIERVRLIFSSGAGPGLQTMELSALILGLLVGMIPGASLWYYVVTRFGWLSQTEAAGVLGSS